MVPSCVGDLCDGVFADPYTARPRHLRDPEIQHLDARFRHQHICRLQIAMRDAGAVCAVHGPGQLDGERQRLIECHRTFEG